ncbi:MAG: hypothetical protein ACTSW7_00685 [Candidatus Thorarchaeota archaeon]|nr:MAG: hypothetical protein DRQ25_15435 [Candidatus Fermentibacteria bacterium]HEC72582.1 hypothetical protein [Thermoplasmatales archaeon]
MTIKLKKIIRARVEPATLSAAYAAMNVFGSEKVNCGHSFIDPIIVFDIDADEFLTGKDLLKEIGVTLRIESETER